MKFAWLTDIHLNFLDSSGVQKFCADMALLEADAFVISGDIGEAPDVAEYLKLLDAHLRRPIAFVLGNHDFYRGSIAGVREAIANLCDACPNLRWLPHSGLIPLSETACIIGHDGWADGRHGDALNSDVRLNDWRLIEELSGLELPARLHKLRSLGDEAAASIRSVLPEALVQFDHVYVLTHVPPFPEGCLYEGRVTSARWLPHVCCQALGNVLRAAMQEFPAKSMTVLCGHTHQRADAHVLPNLRIVTGAAEYRRPGVQQIWEVA